MLRILLIILINSLATLVHAQSNPNSNIIPYQKQRIGFFFSNVGLNGFIGGIGASINKKKGQKLGKTFLKGFGQGCLGGGISYFGKDLTYQIKKRERLEYAWLARLTNSIGNSISQNAASNINFWERWHFNIGLLRLDYYVNERQFQARLFPSAFYGAIVSIKQAKLNWKKSLQMGIMVYEKDGNPRVLGLNSIGFAVVSSIVVNQNITGDRYYELMAHESMHILQYDAFIFTNPLLNRLDAYAKTKSNIYKQLSRFIYFDMNALTMNAVYQSQIKGPWICRYIEREAEHFSTRKELPKCP